MKKANLVHEKKILLVWFLIIIIFLSYCLFVIWNLKNRGIFEYIGIDYRLWYATGMIARYHGFSSIYDVVLQTQYQSPLYLLYPKLTTMVMEFWPLPLPYLPVFTLPFWLFSFFTPISGFLIFSLINIIGTYFYILYYLVREKLLFPHYKLMIVFLSLPLLLNLLFGQVNLWLLICIGEFSYSFKYRKDFKSGLWLGGLLLKPQLLIIFSLGILLQRRGKVFIGLVLSSLILLFVSFIIAGQSAVLGPLNVILQWPTNILGDSGINLLSLANNLSKLIPYEITRIFLTIYSFVIFIFGIKLWIPGKVSIVADNSDLLILTTYAITCLISPHSNIHMAIPIILLGIPVYVKKHLPKVLILCWIFIPSALFLFESISSIGDAHAIGGTAVLGMNLFLIIWISCRCLLNKKEVTNNDK